MNLASLLVTIANASPAELTALWRAHFKEPCPTHPVIRRYLLAWRLQARVHGGLSAPTRQRLHALEQAFARDPNHRPLGVAPVKVGTEYVRFWKGQHHRVRVIASGYEYDGRAYGSLSEIARRITGTRRSGPQFFGTKPTP